MKFQVSLLAASITVISAYGSSGTSGSSGSPAYGTKLSSLGSTSGLKEFRADSGPVNAAVRTEHRVEYYEVPNEGSVKPTMIEVDSTALPMTLLFRTRSSALNVLHEHDGQAGSSQETSSEDEPHLLKHTVKKPVIQELYEVITPMRKIVQEILPVQEEIQTIVARSVGTTTNLGLGGSFGLVGKNLGSAIRNREIETIPFALDNAFDSGDSEKRNPIKILSNSEPEIVQKVEKAKISGGLKGLKIDQKDSY